MAQTTEVTKRSADALILCRHTPAWLMTISFTMAKAKLREQNQLQV